MDGHAGTGLCIVRYDDTLKFGIKVGLVNGLPMAFAQSMSL